MANESPTRDAILDAAERLFARQGFLATTIKQIGAEASVNTALLYYYFGDKETLYREALRRALGAVASGATQRADSAASPAESIRRVVEFQAEFLVSHPHLPRLIARELVDHEASYAERQIVEFPAALFRRMCEIIRAGQRAGVFRNDMRPEFAAVSTVAQVMWLSVARPGLALMMGAELTDEAVRAFGRHAAEFALAALARPAQDEAE